MEATDHEPTHPVGARWTSRSIGSHFGHRFFYFVIRHGGLRPAYFVLPFVVAFYVLFTPSIRRKADYYLLRRFAGKEFIGRLLDSFRIYFNLGKALIDRAAIGILGEERISFEVRDGKKLIDILDEGRGMILMTAHVGCWQTAMSALGHLGRPVHLLMQREEGDVDLHYYEHAGIPCPYSIIDPRGYMGGVLEMMDVLRRGEVLCVMGDRLLGAARGAAAVGFLGGKAQFPFSAYKIASATGAPIVVFFSHKSGPTGYALEVAGVIRVPPDAGKLGKDFLPYVGEFARLLGSYTTAHPYQFYNFYDMWEPGPKDRQSKRGNVNDH